MIHKKGDSMSIRRTTISPVTMSVLFLWTVLYFGAAYVLEKHFPDAAFFSNDNDAAFWVWAGGSVVSLLCGWLLKNWLKNRLSKQTFDRLELGIVILFLIAGLILYHIYAPEFLRIF